MQALRHGHFALATVDDVHTTATVATHHHLLSCSHHHHSNPFTMSKWGNFFDKVKTQAAVAGQQAQTMIHVSGLTEWARRDGACLPRLAPTPLRSPIRRRCLVTFRANEVRRVVRVPRRDRPTSCRASHSRASARKRPRFLRASLVC